jgi:modulator of FtsH protease HflC
MRRVRYLLIALAIILVGQSALYTVDQAEFVYVTRFGEPLEILDGSKDAGLHFKLPWPIDSVQRIDRRLQVFDLPPTESLTRDPQKKTIDKTLAVDAFICWRIPDKKSVDQFVRAVGSPEKAKQLLVPRISSRLSAIISNMPLDNLIQVSGEGGIDQRMERIRQQLLGNEPIRANDVDNEPIAELALKEYGIQIEEIRMRRFSYPEAVRSSIADRIRSERNLKVADYQSKGDRLAKDIISAAERDASKIIADARAQKQMLEGKADVEADEIRNQAHTKDHEFYTFLQKIKAYQSMLGDTRDVLLLSSRHELFDLLLKPPKREEKK